MKKTVTPSGITISRHLKARCTSLPLHHLVTRLAFRRVPDQLAVSETAACLTSINLDELRQLLEQEDLERILPQWLSCEEQNLLAHFSLAKRRLEWLGGRMAAKVALLHLAADDSQSLSPPRLSILPTASGRPACRPLFDSHGVPLSFSISHSGNKAAALAVAGFSCGLDIQVLSPALKSIRERFSDPPERKRLQANKQIAACSKTEQLALLWCAKEAFRKTMVMTPLPAFKEIELLEVPISTENAFILPMRFRRKNERLSFSATAWLHENMAYAHTIISEP